MLRTTFKCSAANFQMYVGVYILSAMFKYTTTKYFFRIKLLTKNGYFIQTFYTKPSLVILFLARCKS